MQEVIKEVFQENEFYLMNKNRIVARFESFRNQYREVSFHLQEQEGQLPIGFTDLGQWLENRQAPKHRAHIESLLRSIGCYDLDGYIRITHALTLNDSFWVKPITSELKWADVSLFQNEFDNTIAHIAFEGGLYGEQFTTTSPEFGTDGAFAKCWIRDEDGIYLLKRGSTGARNSGLEPYSEMYASEIAQIICPEAIKYEVVKYRDKIASKCPLFTSEKEGFAPMYKCISSKPNIENLLSFYADIGSEDSFRRMIVLDALTLNTDRHQGNYGVIFDTDTLEILRMAPIFDNNQALLPYAEEEDFGKNRAEYLASRPPRIGDDFNAIAHDMLTPSIIADLKNLRGFKFNRNTSYALPEERLNALEEIVNMQIDNILQGKYLYINKMASMVSAEQELIEEQAMKQCMKRTAARTPERKLDKELDR